MLRQNQTHLQRLIDKADFCLYVVDVNDYRILAANKTCGFGPLDEFAVCYKCTHNSPVPCSGPHICPLKEVVRTKNPVMAAHTHYARSGRSFPVEVCGVPVMNATGEVVMMIEYSFDVSEGKTAPQGPKIDVLIQKIRDALQSGQ